jgi:hypothetical protein
MTQQASEDIIERALLSLLAPQPALISKVTLVRMRKFRKTKRKLCQPTDETVKKELLPTRISIVERLSPVALSICWNGATSGYFGNQVWRMGFAQFQSFCALSGMPIRIGDSVFRPWLG